MSSRTRRPRLVIITPRLADSNAGNWHTAARWARFLRSRFRVLVEPRWDGQDVDCLIALHARRSAPSIHAFAAAHPQRALIVVLTGTDLYRDIAVDRDAQHSLQVASRLVVLNECGRRRVPRRLRAKTRIVLQSAPALRPAEHAVRRFDVAVVGHLRAEKDPQLVWQMLAHVPPRVRLRVLHAGGAHDAALGRRAAATQRRDPRYTWLGDLPRARARQLIRRAHVLLHPSVMEGGAQAVIEAVTAHTPVIGSRIDGNTGLLGASYPGLFAAGDARAAARLVVRAAEDPRFLRALRAACARRAARFSPAREAAAVIRLVDNALRSRPRSTR
jgi:putative glycosyltransferase (TIGR04348 family)